MQSRFNFAVPISNKSGSALLTQYAEHHACGISCMLSALTGFVPVYITAAYLGQSYVSGSLSLSCGILRVGEEAASIIKAHAWKC